MTEDAPDSDNALLSDGIDETDFGIPINPEMLGFVEINGVLTPIPDVNAYQRKKTFAQGMMDLALLAANANQLRFVLDTNSAHPYYYVGIVLIAMSIALQIIVGIGLIWNTRYDIKNEEEISKANKISNFTVIGIFIVTIVNVLIAAFSVIDSKDIGTGFIYNETMKKESFF
ncbi:ninjurin-1-like [Teleopsis dalmanni]|nr:ninjurin-1-like [Teleopsis dalmanni]